MQYLEPYRRFVNLEIRCAVRTLLLEITILLMSAIQVFQVKQMSLSRNANNYLVKGSVAWNKEARAILTSSPIAQLRAL